MLLTLIFKTPLLGLLIGPLVTWIGNRGQELIPRYDRLPAIGKQAVALLLSFVLAGMVTVLAVPIPEACVDLAANGLGSACIGALLSKEFITAVVTAALTAVAVKHGKQNAR